MAGGDEARTTLTVAEADEIRRLLDELPQVRLAVQRMTLARLRRMGLDIAAQPEVRPTYVRFEDLVTSGAITIDEDDDTARAMIRPHPSGNVFRVAVGVTGQSIPDDWNAFDERYQWLSQRPQSVTSGAHLFVLAVDRWKSAVVGLYETVTAGADKLPGSPNPDRWPWALGIRPLAAVRPQLAVRVEGQRAPQSGLPERVSDPDIQGRLYQAVAGSPPPPGPQTLEQRVQEVEWHDVAADVFDAVRSLGKEARETAVTSRAVELGAWSAEELEARAWYTGTGVDSHIQHIVGQALRFEVGSKGKLRRVHGVYSLRTPASHAGFGVTYRPAGDGQPSDEELPPHVVDLAELDRATTRHMDLQDELADALRRLGVEPRSPGSWQPPFDLGFEHHGTYYVVEVKSGDPVSAQQLRLGAGQVLEYHHLLQATISGELDAVLLIETAPPSPWDELAAAVGIRLLRADGLVESLSELLGLAK